MKRTYEIAEIQVFFFEKPEVIVASGIADVTDASTIDTDETEIL